MAGSDEDFWEKRLREHDALLRGSAPADPQAALVRAIHDKAHLDAAHALLALDGVDAGLVRAALAERLRDAGFAASADPDAVRAMADDGTLSVDNLAQVGLSPAGIAANAAFLARLSGLDERRILAFAAQIDAPRAVWQQETWDTYGVTLEVVYLLVATQDGSLAAWILPHDVRTIATHAATRLIGPVQEGDVNNGRIWTQLYADVIVGIAMDNHGLTDALVLHLPLSLYLESNWRCTQTLFGACVGWSFSSASGPGDSLVAEDATYTFAYPANAGEFPTRVTGQDLLQSVYDRLGSLPHAAPTDYAFRSHVADTPGAAELSTQAPPVTYYGLQVSPELAPLADVVKHVRVHAPAPYVVADSGVPEVGAIGIGPYDIGPTAGYHALEVRGNELTWLIVRWHHVGVESLGTGALSSSPATFYYDVPAGKYKLTDARVDAYGGVLVTDWALAGDLPAAPAAPSAPTMPI